MPISVPKPRKPGGGRLVAACMPGVAPAVMAPGRSDVDDGACPSISAPVTPPTSVAATWFQSVDRRCEQPEQDDDQGADPGPPEHALEPVVDVAGKGSADHPVLPTAEAGQALP